jgi:beta-glucosidase
MSHTKLRRLALIPTVALSIIFSSMAVVTPPAHADDALEEAVNATLATLTTAQRNRLMYGDGVNNLVAVGDVPALNMGDGPLGFNGDGVADGTAFGSGLVIASTWNKELINSVGDVLGKEVKYNGREIHLGPGINLNRDLGGGRTFEYFTEDPYLNAQITAEYIKGVQAQNVASTPKHILANNAETNRNWVTSNISERAMHEVYLAPFKAAVEDADVWGLMTSAGRVNGTFVSDNRYILTNLTKNDWGMSGLIMTDWIKVRTDIIAAKAGTDVSMPNSDLYTKLASYVQQGKLPAAAIDNAAQRIIRVAKMTGAPISGGEENTPANRAVALQVAEEGIVLLKNQDNILPIPESTAKIALLGKYVSKEFDATSMGGSSYMRPADQKSYLEGLNNYKSAHSLTTQFVIPTYSETTANLDTTIANAVAAAQESDYAIIFAGIEKGDPYIPQGPDSEDGDVFDLSFPAPQLQLIKAVAAAAPNKTIVVMNGSAREIRDFADDVKGIMTMFYGGEEGGTAVAEILFGAVNPSGKLSFTWPRRYADTEGFIASAGPTAEDQKVAKTNDVFYTEGVNVGYRYHDANNVPYEYPFGYGLSYTNFTYGTATASATTMGPEDSITISVPVTNSGTRDGKETVELYISDPVSSVARPVKELKGFTKLDIPAGQTRTATFTVDASSLSFWDVNTHSFKAEAGEFIARIGSSAATLPATVSFTLTSSTAPDPEYTVVQAEAYASASGTSVESNYEVDDPTHTTPIGHLLFNSTSAEATWNVNVPTAGKYSIIFRYSNDSFSGSVTGAESFGKNMLTDLVVNGMTVGKYDFMNTRYQNVYNYDSIDVTLAAGANTIGLKATSDTPGLRVEKLILQQLIDRFPAPAPAPANDDFTPPESTEDGDVYQAESGRDLTNAKVRAENAGYTGTGYVDLAAGGSFTMDITSDARMASRLQFTYANGGDVAAPVNVYVNGNQVYTLTLGTTGGWDSWKCEQTVPLPVTAGNNVVYLESAGGRVIIDKVLLYGGMGYLDETAPVVNGSSPNSHGETTHSYAEVYFSETVQLGDGDVTLYDDEGNVVPSSVSLESNILRVTANNALTPGKTYKVTVAADAVHDLIDANNQATRNLAAPYTFKFTVKPVVAVDDPAYIYTGTWTDTPNGKVADPGASVEFYYSGKQVAVFGSGTGTVSVMKEDDAAVDVDLATVTGNEVVSASYLSGVHYVKITVPTDSTFTFKGAATDGVLTKPLDTSLWTVTPFQNIHPTTDPQENIIDGNRDLRWASGALLASGHWINIDFGEVINVNSLVWIARDNSYFKAYSLYASTDGVNWGEPISTGDLSQMYGIMKFPTQQTRYLRVVSNGTSTDKWLCINELYAFYTPVADQTPPTVPGDFAAVGYNGFIRVDWSASEDESTVTYELFRDGVKVTTLRDKYYFVDLYADMSVPHTYTVRAYDESGNYSAMSAPVTGQMDPANTKLPNSDWALTGTISTPWDAVGHPGEYAIDGDHETWYRTNSLQATARIFRIDLGDYYPVSMMAIDSGGSDEYGRRYRLRTSTSGWEVSATTAFNNVNGFQDPRIQEIPFTNTGGAVLARYMTIDLRTSASVQWTVYEFEFFYTLSSDYSMSAPTGLTATGYNGFNRLDWTASPSGKVAVTGYQVYRDGEKLGTTGTTPVFVDTSPKPGTAHVYTVSATGALSAESEQSAPVTQATVPANTEIPKAPINYWAGTASPNNGSPGNAVDNNDSTAYTGTANQAVGNYVRADLGSSYPFNRVAVLSSSATDFGKEYKIEVSANGSTWTEVATAQAGVSGTKVTDLADRQTARYVRLTLTDADTTVPWSIDEIRVYNVTSKAELEAVISAAQALTEADYTTSTWASLPTALAQAESVDADAGATETQVATAAQNLQHAIDALKLRGDPTALDAVISDAQAVAALGRLSLTDQATLTTAIAGAKAVFDNATDKTQTEIDAATNKLQQALTVAKAELLAADRTALAALADAVAALGPISDVFSPATVEALEKALAEAQEILADPTSTQAEVEDARGDLNAALAGLTANPNSAAAQAAAAAAQAAAEAQAALDQAAALAAQAQQHKAAMQAALAAADAQKALELAQAAQDKLDALSQAAQEKAQALLDAANNAAIDKASALAAAEQAYQLQLQAAALAAEADKVTALAQAALDAANALEAALEAAEADNAAALEAAAKAAEADKAAALEAAAKAAESEKAAALAAAEAQKQAELAAAAAAALAEKTALTEENNKTKAKVPQQATTKSVKVTAAKFKKNTKPVVFVTVTLSAGYPKGKVALYVNGKWVKSINVVNKKTKVKLPKKYAKAISVKAKYVPKAAKNGATGTVKTSKAVKVKIK